MRIVGVIERLAFFVGFGGLVAGFVAQWLIFEPGNFSDRTGPVYIPLGENGIYTSKRLGFTWWGGTVIFALSVAAILVCRALKERNRS